MLTDIEIAQQTKLRPIKDVAKDIGITEDELEFYGKYKAKLSEELFKKLESKPDGKLILVTAINPTPAGEGKTTVTTGLGQAMNKLGKKTVIALREPSLGPVFGIKGGAAGGGYSQVLPMEDINLHFTGDMHAITAANNLLCAMLDNHIQQGNELGIDVKRILIKRCLDMNDRELRNIVAGLGGKINGVPREDGFIITVASEVMAILCLADSISDLKERLGNILVAYSYDGKPVFAKDIHANGAMTALLKDAIKPNLVQTIDGTPAIAGLKPNAVVLVATVRALKYNGGVPKTELKTENLDALKNGIVNLGKHIENMKKFGVPVVVAINRFESDTDAELNFVENYCKDNGADFSLAEVFAKGAEGGLELAKKVCEATEKPSDFKPIYENGLTITEKLEAIAKNIYGASGVVFTPKAKKALAEVEKLYKDDMPICVAKTQYSLSDNPAFLGRPEGFVITVSDVRISNGAGFVVIYTGDIMTMPGLPKVPAANRIDVDDNGKISGLF